MTARVLRVARALRDRKRPGLRDVVESYCAVTVHFDPLKTDVVELLSDLRAEAARVGVSTAIPNEARRELIVPVCYGGDLGPDLAAVAEFGGCSDADVIEIHIAMLLTAGSPR